MPAILPFHGGPSRHFGANGAVAGRALMGRAEPRRKEPSPTGKAEPWWEDGHRWGGWRKGEPDETGAAVRPRPGAGGHGCLRRRGRAGQP
ncbi:hypothetical protein FRAHR75_550041 [Frankia sp. Hr75.2]|nr:hypothetical protein FRAHR75_550041 [Frankia sp. Hr75.2]